MRSLARDTLLMALATAISRIFGLFRDVTIANKFGASGAYDAFLIAFFLPVFLRQLLAEGALSTAFIPVYTDSMLKESDANRLASNVLSILIVVFPIIVGAGIYLAPVYLPFLASGFGAEKLALSISLARIIFPFIALVGGAAVFMGILNAHHRFFAPSFAPVWFNVGMILGALFLSSLFPRNPIYGLALGVIIGGAGQLISQIPHLRKTGFRFRFIIWPLHPGVRRMACLMLPAILGLAVTQINLLVDNKLASHLGDGGISSLQYAMRLFQLPLGIFAVSIASALLPRFSASVARGETREFSAYLSDGISTSALILLPAMAGLYAIGPSVIHLLFEHGSFSAGDSSRTWLALSFYLVGVLPYGLVFILTRAYYALGRTRIPLVASVCAVAANVICDITLVTPLRVGGLALATSIAGLVNLVILAAFLRHELASLVLIGPRLAKISLGTGIAFAAAWGTQAVATGEWMTVLFPMIAAIVVYLAFVRLSGLWQLLSRKVHD
jgi:putative peptidoglycan lipid II flippase